MTDQVELPCKRAMYVLVSLEQTVRMIAMMATTGQPTNLHNMADMSSLY